MAEKVKYVGNGAKSEKNKVSFKRSLSFALALALIIIAALVGLEIAEKTSVEALSGDKSENGGYPVSFSTNDIRDVKAMDKNLVVLTKKFVTVLDRKGEIILEHAITYGDPAVITNERYTLVYDRLSNKYSLISSDGKISERQTDRSSQIFNAEVTEKGEVLLALKSDSSSSKVSVSDKKGEDRFIWSCTEEYVVDLALSSDGNTLYCGSISAADGEMYTKVYALNMKNGEEKSYTIPSSACVSLNSLSSDKFNVLTNEGIYVFDSGKDEMLINSAAFNSKLIYYSADSEGNIAALTQGAGNISENTLTVYEEDAQEKFSVSVQNGVEDIFIQKDEALLLYSDSVVAVKKGEITDKLTFESKAVGVVKSAKQIYCYSLGGVEKAKG